MAPRVTIRKKMSDDERKARDRERKRRERASMTPAQIAQQKEAYRKYDQEKRKKMADRTEREKRKIRKRKRESNRNSRQKKAQLQRAENCIRSMTPESDHSGEMEVAQEIYMGPQLLIQEPAQIVLPDNPRELAPPAVAVGPIPGPSRQLLQAKRKKLATKKRHEREVERLKHLLEMEKRKNMKLRKQLSRKNPKPTPLKIIKHVERNLENPDVRRRVVYNEIVVRHIESQKNNIQNHKEAQKVAAIVTPPKLKTYKLLSSHKGLISHRQYRNLITEKVPCLKARKWGLKVKTFLEEDINSRMSSGKKETITKKKKKMQKRYLLNSLKNLHEEFVKKHGKMSYSEFCKLKPFWIVDPKIAERDTCACIIHSNFWLIAKKLAFHKILDLSTLKEYLGQYTHSFEINLPENMKEDLVHYWQRRKMAEERMIKGVEKSVRTVQKVKLRTEMKNLCAVFFEALPMFLEHVKNINHQYMAMKSLKENLRDNEILVNIDFSENYATKYNEEIQSVHFGASRKQLALHTGVFYYRNSSESALQHKSFGTLCSNLDHGVHAIAAHMAPVFIQMKEIVQTDIEIIHFLSDGPTAQYKNKFNICFMLHKLKKTFPRFKAFSWNFSIAGHGKGPADGVGEALKRRADKFVTYGNDLIEEEAVAEVLQRQSAIFVSLVPPTSVESMQKELQVFKRSPNVVSFKGITKMHQIIWTGSRYILNKLSKFPITVHSKLHYDDVYSASDEGRAGEDEFLEGDYVKVKYVGKDYPGKILQILGGQKFKISCMEKMLKTNTWRWPASLDTLDDYTMQDIICKIKPPLPTSSNRGVYYKVPEIAYD